MDIEIISEFLHHSEDASNCILKNRKLFIEATPAIVLCQYIHKSDITVKNRIERLNRCLNKTKNTLSRERILIWSSTGCEVRTFYAKQTPKSGAVNNAVIRKI